MTAELDIILRFASPEQDEPLAGADAEAATSRPCTLADLQTSPWSTIPQPRAASGSGEDHTEGKETACTVEMPHTPELAQQLSLLVQAPCARISTWLHLHAETTGPKQRCDEPFQLYFRSLSRVILFQLDVEAPHELAKPGQRFEPVPIDLARVNCCDLVIKLGNRRCIFFFKALHLEAKPSCGVCSRRMSIRMSGPCPLAAGHLICFYSAVELTTTARCT